MTGLVRITGHWAGSTHEVTPYLLSVYNGVVDGEGNRFYGVRPEMQIAPIRGKPYAAHTGRFNTGNIGLSMAAMGGRDVTQIPYNEGRWPITAVQYKSFIEFTAEFCQIYDIKVTPETVAWHAEIEEIHGVKQRGKWDVRAGIPGTTGVIPAREAGDLYRAQVQAVLDGDSDDEAPDLPKVPDSVMLSYRALEEIGAVTWRARRELKAMHPELKG